MTNGTSARPPTGAQPLVAHRRHVEATALIRLAVKALGRNARLMPLRGVLLGAAGFVEPSHRPLYDVDVLVDGISIGSAVAKLGRAGFRIERSSDVDGGIPLSHPKFATLYLDLHRAPLPFWFGRVTSSYLFAEARADNSLFGVPVFVPSSPRLAVHLIGHIVKDRVVGAYRHAATDLAAVVAGCSPVELEQIARHLRRLSLHNGGVLAVLWAQAISGGAALEELATILEPNTQIRNERWEQIMSLKGDEPQALISRALSRGPRSLRPSLVRQAVKIFGLCSWSIARIWIALRWRAASEFR